MNWQALVDPALCGRLCLTLLHSLWQVALLVAAARAIDWLLGSRSVEKRYALYVVALFLSLVAGPITYTYLSDRPTAHESLADGTSPAQATSAANLPGKIALLPGDAAKPHEHLGELPKTFGATSSAPEISLPNLSLPNRSKFSDRLAQITPWIVGLYVMGVVVMLGRLATGMWRAQRLVARAQILRQGPLVDTLRALARGWSMRIVPKLARAEQMIVPKVIGLLRPTILLPASAISGLSPAELEMILAHELAHVRRYDMWVNLVQRLTEAVLFFNPALWYLSRRLSTLREFCCDELTCRAIARSTANSADDPRTRYALALLKVVELSRPTGAARHGKPPTIDGNQIAALAASGRGPSELRRRVAHLFGEPLREPVRLSRGGLLSLVALVLVLLAGPAVWPIKAQSEKAKQQAKDKIEIVAIGTQGEEPQRWWQADGKPLDSVPFQVKAGHRAPIAGQMYRQLVLRTHDLPKDADVRWDIPNSTSSESGTLLFNAANESREYEANVFGINKDIKSTNLRVGIARGDWATIADAERDAAPAIGAGKSTKGGHVGVVFSGAFQRDGVTVLVVSHNAQDLNCRVVAIDKQGKTHPSGRHNSRSAAGTVNQEQWQWSEPKFDEIERFDFQTREYEWTDLGEVAMNPSEEPAKKKAAPADGASEAQATISGRIVLEDGSPATTEGNMHYSSKNKQGNSTGENTGRHIDHFSCAIEPGTIWLSYTSQGFAPVVLGPFELEPGQEKNDLTIVLKKGYSVPLRLTNQQGQPIAGAKFSLFAVLGTSGSAVGLGISMAINSNGEYQLEHLANVKYNLTIQAPGYEPLSRERFDIEPGKPLVLTMAAAEPTTGIVLNVDGKPAVGAKLRLRMKASPGQSITSSPLDDTDNVMATTDEAGRFTLDQLASTSRYLFSVETADQARLLVDDFAPGQKDLRLTVPARRDLHVRIMGDLAKLENRDGKPIVQVTQRIVKQEKNFATDTDITFANVEVTPNVEGGEAVYKGLVTNKIAVQAGDQSQTVDVAETGDTEVVFQFAAAPKKDLNEPKEYSAPINISGRALNKQGEAVAGAEIYLASDRPGNKRIAETKTDAQGVYKFENVMLPIEGATTNAGQDSGSFEVFGTAEGYALAWRPRKSFYPGREHVLDSWGDPKHDQPPSYGTKDNIELDLTFGPPKSFSGRVVDDDGKPLPDTELAIRYCDTQWDQLDYSSSGFEGTLNSLNEQAIVPPSIKIRKTDAQGRFEFTCLPADYRWSIDIRPPGHPSRRIWVVTHDDITADAKGQRVYSGDFELTFAKPRAIKFRVVLADTDEPAPKVFVNGSVGEVGTWKTSDDDGLVEFLLPDGPCKLSVSPRYLTPYLRTEAEAVVSADSAKEITTIRLRPAAVVDIVVVDEDSGGRLQGADLWLDKIYPGNETPHREIYGYRSWEVETRISHYDRHISDENGKMRVFFEPGKHRIGVGLNNYPEGYEAVDPDGQEIECQVGKPTSVEFKMRRKNGAAQQKQPAANQAAEAATEKQQASDKVELTEKTVCIVNPAGKPIAGATVVPWAVKVSTGFCTWTKGTYESDPQASTTDADGKTILHFPRFAKLAGKFTAHTLVCRVGHPDYAETIYNDVWIRKKDLDTPTTLTLQPGAQVQVRAFADGRPISPEHLYAICTHSFYGRGLETKVNANNGLQLPRLPGEMQLLRLAYLPPKGPAMFSKVQKLQLLDNQRLDVRVEMQPSVKVQGRLDDRVPRPVKNGRVLVDVAVREDRWKNLNWQAWTKIEQDGSFVLDDLPRGHLQVIALCDGFMAEDGESPAFAPEQAGTPAIFAHRPQVFVLDKQINPITLKMVPTVDCRLRVLDPDGNPVAGVECAFSPNVAWWDGGAQGYGMLLASTSETLKNPQSITDQVAKSEQLFTAKTDADGRAIVRNLPAGSNPLVIVHDDWDLPLNLINRQSIVRMNMIDLAVGKQSEIEVYVERKGTTFSEDDFSEYDEWMAIGDPPGNQDEPKETNQENKGENGDAPVESPDEDSSATGAAKKDAAVEKPEKVLERFLTALKEGKTDEAEKLLSPKARETRKQYNFLGDGDPQQNTFKIGKTTQRQNMAYVPVEFKGPMPLETMYILKLREGEWRITGMGSEDESVDFENPQSILRSAYQHANSEVPSKYAFLNADEPNANGSKEPANRKAKADESPEDEAADAAGEKPEEIVERFITAMDEGKEAEAEKLLSPKARKTNAKQSFIGGGTPNKTKLKFFVQDTTYLRDTAYVSVVFGGASGTEPGTYILKRREGGWRVTGMIDQEDGRNHPFDFENPAFHNVVMNLSQVDRSVVSPEKIVEQFLAAIKAGKADDARKLLSERAREHITEDSLKSFKFEQKVEGASYKHKTSYPFSDTAYVSFKAEEKKKKETDDEGIWVLKKGNDGWRISGVIIAGLDLSELRKQLPENIDPAQKQALEALITKAKNSNYLLDFENFDSLGMQIQMDSMINPTPAEDDGAAAEPKEDQDAAAKSQKTAPDKIVEQFFAAIKAGEDDKVQALLSPKQNEPFQASGLAPLRKSDSKITKTEVHDSPSEYSPSLASVRVEISTGNDRQGLAGSAALRLKKYDGQWRILSMSLSGNDTLITELTKSLKLEQLRQEASKYGEHGEDAEEGILIEFEEAEPVQNTEADPASITQ